MATMASLILVVDDDPAFRGLARRVLSGMCLVVGGEAGTVAAAKDQLPNAPLHRLLGAG
jgi:CheY-like chemotaxis protein